MRVTGLPADCYALAQNILLRVLPLGLRWVYFEISRICIGPKKPQNAGVSTG